MEFALIGPVMIAVLFGVIDFSRAFYYAEIAAGAARSGTQYALQNTADAANTTTMVAQATADATTNTTSAQNFAATATTFCQCANSTTTVSCSSSCGSSAMWQYAQVNTSLQFSTLFNYYLLPQTFTIAGSSTVRTQ
jgi:Flp pilus assembly protein TadG